ncbi:hypothetical protein LENED_000659 [Lentinula edodes]|uniref:Uncharacterized protein n=1 Tax=Lentinula edodes TaxID=5353 RepID=A0A1Q3DW38_LENED|nr:hypothetical protein LENED_000659 [Lentinula edodes]
MRCLRITDRFRSRRLASVSSSSLETLSSQGYTSTLESVASTFTGPGSLTGKALFNFGKFTLKGFEQLIISRRLLAIGAHFPHHNADRIVGLAAMYADLLELSRIQLYPDSTRTRALQLLLGQIASRSTAHLMKALLIWPVVEVKLLISELLQCFDPLSIFNLVENNLPHALVSPYQQHLSQWEDHSLAPIVDFLQDFASASEQGCLWALWPMLALKTPDQTRCSQRRQSFLGHLNWTMRYPFEPSGRYIDFGPVSLQQRLIGDWRSTLRKLLTTTLEISSFGSFVNSIYFQLELQSPMHFSTLVMKGARQRVAHLN